MGEWELLFLDAEAIEEVSVGRLKNAFVLTAEPEFHTNLEYHAHSRFVLNVASI